MYKCRDCGEIFEIPHIVKDYEFGADEPGCPYCGGDFDHVQECEECGEVFEDSEMFNGYCRECALQLVSPETFLGFIEKTGTYFEDFCFEVFFGITAPRESSSELRASLENVYRDNAKSDEFFLAKCRAWLAVDDCCIDEYVTYYKEVMND